MIRRSLAAFASFLSIAIAPAATASDSAKERVPPRPWEHELTDVAPHPALRFGALDNGVRYVWTDHAVPKERVCAWMHVDVGSLAEEEHELGMAHFLEHMAFNGSDNFPPGTLIQWLQERGLEFGADSNARTGLSDTVYTFDLPASGEKALREGFQVLSDIAGRLTLSQEEIDAEKGVIDGEERERDSAQFRLLFDTLKEYFAGARIATRLPIGTKAARDAFSAETVRAFYEKWYRADQLTLIVVGDLAGVDPTPLIEEYFGGLKPPIGERPAEPALGAPRFEKPFYHRYEPEVPIAQITYARYRPWKERPYDQARVAADVPIDVACDLLNRRFAEAAKSGKAPFLQARLSWDEAREIGTTGPSLMIIAQPDKWEEAFLHAELALRGAIEHGFQEEELRVRIADLRRGLDEAVRRESTLQANMIAEQLAAAAESRVVPLSAETRRTILDPAYSALTVEVCQKALAAAWSEGVVGIQCVGGVDLGADASARLESMWKAAIARETEKPERIETAKFAYSSNPERAGQVADRSEIEPGIVAVRFENGVEARIKATDFTKGEIRFTATIGEGGLATPLDAAALRFAADDAMSLTGLEAHDVDQLRRITAGKAVSVAFGVGEDAFTLGGAAAPEDLLLALELAAANVMHCGWRDDGLRRLKREYPQQLEQMAHTLQGAFALRAERALYSGDPRFGLPTLDAINAIEMAEVRNWIEPILKDGPIGIAVVGDLDVDATIAALARTFGALPKRRALVVDEKRLVPAKLATGLTLRESVETRIPGGLVLALFQADDGIDPARRRDLHFLARVLQDRVLQIVREKLGASYSPYAYEDLSTVYPGMGRFVIHAEGAPETAEELAKAVIGVGASLFESGVAADEVSRLREPLLAQLRDQKSKNAFWLSVMARSLRRESAVAEALEAEAYYQALTAEHLSAIAKKYFDPKLASVVIATPKTATTAPAGQGGGR